MLTSYPQEHGPRTGETIVFLHGANMGGWTWLPQIELLSERHLLTPDLPGYASRAGERWPGLAGAADDIADRIRRDAVAGRAHVVGLSLGGFVAVHLLHRHPELVRSATVTGVALAGYSRAERVLIRPQVPLWQRRWYWWLQALPFGIPPDSREVFVDSATAASAQTNRAMFAEVAASGMPVGPFAYAGPVLAVSGQRESASIRRGFEPLQERLPQLQTWMAPGMHHPWSAEDPALFSAMVVSMADTGCWPDADARGRTV
ncbi:alpha/beta fold hydrolase [Granulicoccus phenolivorans]|uniref:alpha/beta fold hydrolase n=1 Tax=Granulicoccus phenolivorans TaxID=266854 RepID=UPI0004110061|nr:alpha/beta fold hydrolase [Granulicoccus phenolivorans]